MEKVSDIGGGLRARKRRETHNRIATAGLNLFIDKGYDATTLDDIAAAAGISRRTFFYYFKSKEEILEFWQGDGFMQALGPAIIQQSEGAPLDVVCHALLELASRYETDQSIVVDRLMQSTEALRARKQAIYAEMERVVFTALCQRWPQGKRRAALRAVAMVSIGTMRLAMEAWRADKGARPIASYLRQGFVTLRAEI